MHEAPLDALIRQIDAQLPQTQCRQCQFEGCRPYAAAIARHEAPINQCPPGGEAGILKLATLLKVPVIPLNPAHGQYKPKHIAVVDEANCVGCTLCIQACPVDAILGAAKLMHTVIAAECTGCELCVAPCPTACIEMVLLTPPPNPEQQQQSADLARQRHDFRALRLAREAQEKADRLAEKGTQAGQVAQTLSKEANQKHMLIEAALARIAEKPPQ